MKQYVNENWPKPEDAITFRRIQPQCPKCGSNMRIKTARVSGNLFWGCTAWRKTEGGCNGAVDFHKWLATEATDSYVKQMGKYLSYSNQPYQASYTMPLQYAPPSNLRWGALMFIRSDLQSELQRS